MDEKTKSRLSKVGQRHFHLLEFDKKEVLIAEIRKHPIGLFFIFFLGTFITLAIMGFSVFIGRSSSATSFFEEVGINSSLQTITLILGMLLAAFVIIFTIINAVLYENNVIFVTNEKIAQVLYKNIFNRQLSQLSIGDVQDVNVSQVGVLARIFNYGTLVIETAGEQDNYIFTYIPDPYNASKVIVNAHEENLKLYGN